MFKPDTATDPERDPDVFATVFIATVFAPDSADHNETIGVYTSRPVANAAARDYVTVYAIINPDESSDPEDYYTVTETPLRPSFPSTAAFRKSAGRWLAQ